MSRACCDAGAVAYPDPCPWHGVAEEVLRFIDAEMGLRLTSWQRQIVESAYHSTMARRDFRIAPDLVPSDVLTRIDSAVEAWESGPDAFVVKHPLEERTDG